MKDYTAQPSSLIQNWIPDLQSRIPARRSWIPGIPRCPDAGYGIKDRVSAWITDEGSRMKDCTAQPSSSIQNWIPDRQSRIPDRRSSTPDARHAPMRDAGCGIKDRGSAWIKDQG